MENENLTKNRHCEEWSDEAISGMDTASRDCFATLAMTLWLKKIKNRINKYDINIF